MSSLQSNAGQREVWSGQAKFLFAAIGSAVGLGNIWKFPYVTGANGGALFVLIYLFFVLFFSLPLLISELSLGHWAKQNLVAGISAIAKKSGRSRHWAKLGFLALLTAFAQATFYNVIASWPLAYFIEALFTGFDGMNADSSRAIFEGLLGNLNQLLIWNGIYLAAAAIILVRGINRGIGMAASILMPALFGILVLLALFGAFSGHFEEAFTFLFFPDLSQIKSDTVLMAAGQAFFSTSVGIGVMATYASRLPEGVSIPRLAMTIVSADILVALIAGLAIFPFVFQGGLEPSEGFDLIFITLPTVFSTLPLGQLLGALFFLLLAFAAFTSSLSVMEPLVNYVEERFLLTRRFAVLIVVSIVWLFGLATILSFNVLRDLHPLALLGIPSDFNNFDVIEFASVNIGQPISAVLIAVFVGLLIRRKTSRDRVGFKSGPIATAWEMLSVWIAPIVVFLLMLNAIWAET